MNLGIVGHARDKFTPTTEAIARRVIRDLIAEYEPDKVVSGHCPIGGVDIWAEEEADALGVEKLIFPPKTNNWLDGFKPRNIQIYENSDVCACVVVSTLPGGYRGRVFEDCYHCKGRNPPHVKSGGCWTTWRCKGRVWRIIE